MLRVLMIGVMLLMAAPLHASELVVAVWSNKYLANFPIFYAQKKGMYQKAGIEVTIVPIIEGAKQLAALQRGDVHATDGFMNVLASNDLVVTAVLSGSTYYLVSNDSVKSAHDLGGKRVGISNCRTEEELRQDIAQKQPKVDVMAERAVEWYAAQHGFRTHCGVPAGHLDAKTVYLIPAGAWTSHRIAALHRGEIDVTVASAPTQYRALTQPGFRILAEPHELGPIPQAAITMTRAFVEAHPHIVRMFVNTTMQAARELKENPESATAFIRSLLAEDADLNLTLHPARVEQIYALGRAAWYTEPRPAPKELQTIGELYTRIPGYVLPHHFSY